MPRYSLPVAHDGRIVAPARTPAIDAKGERPLRDGLAIRAGRPDHEIEPARADNASFGVNSTVQERGEKSGNRG